MPACNNRITFRNYTINKLKRQFFALSNRNYRRKPHRAINAPILDCKELNCQNIHNEIATNSLSSLLLVGVPVSF
jgi:hypothetical protein